MCVASIVVPVYNVATYLDDCLESLLAQTCADIELICVDDGSTDESGALLDAWATRDGRISVVHKPNGGLSSARNAGIERARGSYVLFVDSDDALEPDAVECLLEAFERTGADVVTFGASCFDGEPTPWLQRCLSPREALFESFSPSILTDEASNPFAWRTAVRLDWLRVDGPLFDEDIRYGEDTVWHFSLYPAAPSVALIPNKLYRYRLGRAGSLMGEHGQGSSQRIADHVSVVEHVFAVWDEKGYLRSWGSELVSWSVDYVLYAALRQAPGEERTQSLNRLAELYRMRCAGILAPRAVQGLLSLLATGSYDGRKAKLAALRWRLWRYGPLDLVQTLLGLGGGRSGSRE